MSHSQQPTNLDPADRNVATLSQADQSRESNIRGGAEKQGGRSAVIRDCSNSTVDPITEEDLAVWRIERGGRVICHRGRYWEANPAGFYNGLHYMARMSTAEVARPTGLCWGYRTTLRMEESDRANGTMPVHLLVDVKNYTIETIGSKRRNKIRNCHKRAEIVEFIEPELLLEEGYGVLVSARRRTGYGRVPPEEEYRREIASYFGRRRGFVLGGLIDGKLGGYVAAFAVGGTAYIQNVELATEALRTNIGTTLAFELVQACRRGGAINEVVYGLHSREDAPLCHFKEQMGFPAVQAPARFWFMPFTEKIVRWLRPNAYYRLTGHD